MSPDCLFCRITRREIPAKIIAETDEALAFHDVNPQAPIHILVIPKTHIPSLAPSVDPTTLGAILALAAQVAHDQGIADSGFRTVLNTNADAGQSVPHLHAHVLGGRHMAWPPG